ncbi:hypothetical protein J0J21_23090, partial [Vibrio vulnificus]|uniref:lipoxygenase family protein n=1 Tax=Vibrio vulnificus TaxID=672 RepID=UPI0019D415D5
VIDFPSLEKRVKKTQFIMYSLLGLLVMELISRHSPDEVYIGQQDLKHLTSDPAALEASKRFTQSPTKDHVPSKIGIFL